MNNTGTIIIAGIGAVSIGYLVALAVGSTFIDDDYLCVCTGGGTSGVDRKVVTVPVNGPVGQCPHPNRFNNLFCN